MLPVISPERLYSGQSSPPETVRPFIQLIISSASLVTRFSSRSTEGIEIDLIIFAFYHSSARYFLMYKILFMQIWTPILNRSWSRFNQNELWRKYKLNKLFSQSKDSGDFINLKYQRNSLKYYVWDSLRFWKLMSHVCSI